MAQPRVSNGKNLVRQRDAIRIYLWLAILVLLAACIHRPANQPHEFYFYFRRKKLHKGPSVYVCLSVQSFLSSFLFSSVVRVCRFHFFPTPLLRSRRSGEIFAMAVLSESLACRTCTRAPRRRPRLLTFRLQGARGAEFSFST